MARHYRLTYGTLEIDGVRMHQTSWLNPLQDAEARVDLLRPKSGFSALDVCTGLGYSALELARRGCKVLTVEKDETVLEMAGQNPDSTGLFNNPLIQIEVADANVFVPTLPDEHVHVICHDPPRFSWAGELYSGAFYRELFRVLKPSGRLFHYTGKPGVKTGKNIPRGVKERLKLAGFQNVRWIEDRVGFLAEKPRRPAAGGKEKNGIFRYESALRI